MKSKLFKRLSIMAVLVLVVLIGSQALWLWRQLEQEKQTFTSKLESTLQGMINFHALQGYSTPNPTKPDMATVLMDETANEETDKDTSVELGRSEISTKKYMPDFALGKLIEASFADKSLEKEKFHLCIVDSLFQNNFHEIGRIRAYCMELVKNGLSIDSLHQGKWMGKVSINSPSTLHVRIPLGTKETYIFTADFQLKTFPFLREMVYSIGISALAVILVAVFMLWLLWALQKQVAQLLWRERAVSGMVHDLKTPLSYVYTLLDYLASKEQQPAIQQQLRSASSNVSKLTHKMEILLTLFRAKKKKIVLEAAPFNLAQKCRDLFLEFEVVYQDKQAECKLSISENLDIYVDPLYFEAALRNLLDNAFKYSDAIAKLEIKAIREQKQLHICITDSGKGIPQKEQRKIFQEFYRADNNSKGHGIGLAFTQQIVKAHKGRIRLESKLGKGSTFWIVLPEKVIV
ncbi:GHKL domain-containing protein [Labilibaculum sp. A4]|uniref:sensor histidine kinase n=1 Tax=Labilibaculum euxinus TaxID=2686357 RepID=UPI000F6277B3|nr:HAMP domain-containing sensor histidine kinase [Labilibaculum euxinus]MDQ1769531.1 HAMP domain-containing sensor histidine kinase [Labilibaculum euxinus]MWN75056.1 GHKL domain-containing protein [Labilibaculum euxinus]